MKSFFLIYIYVFLQIFSFCEAIINPETDSIVSNLFELNDLIEDVPEDLSIHLPENLKSDKNIKYLGAIRQKDGFSCGYWSVFNAAAISYLLSKNQPVVSQNIAIQSLLAKLLSNQCPDIEKIVVCQKNSSPGECASDEDLYSFSKSLNIPNFYILGKFQGDNIYVPHLSSKNLTLLFEVPENMTRKEVIESFYNDAIINFASQKLPGAIHFSCNIGGHWILVSFVKENNNKYMLILDSGNGSMVHNKDLLDMLYEIFKTKFVTNV